jgi:hypothetical protein
MCPLRSRTVSGNHGGSYSSPRSGRYPQEPSCLGKCSRGRTILSLHIRGSLWPSENRKAERQSGSLAPLGRLSAIVETITCEIRTYVCKRLGYNSRSKSDGELPRMHPVHPSFDPCPTNQAGRRTRLSSPAALRVACAGPSRFGRGSAVCPPHLDRPFRFARSSPGSPECGS